MRRPGITLLEVLSAIFIAGIGLLSLLTLFPLGALKMVEALQDDRAALAGGNGKAIANATLMQLDPDVQAAMLNGNISATSWPVPPLTSSQPFPVAATPTVDGPGYPVLVDPIGRLAYPAPPISNFQYWVAGVVGVTPSAGTPYCGIPRVQGQWLKPSNGVSLTTTDYLKWCTLLDDINFNGDGNYQGESSDPPVWAGGIGTMQRIERFSYAWLMRMPRAASPNVVDVSVLVFAGRSIDYVGTASQESAYQAVFNAPANSVTIYAASAGAQPPDLRRGQWILDASASVNATTNTLSVRGFFYRIVSVSDVAIDPNNNTAYITVEVQTKLRGWIGGDPAFAATPVAVGPSVTGQLGTVMVFENLIEVFDDGTF
jgi:hypothetical protein